MVAEPKPVREEYFENEALGVEAEEVEPVEEAEPAIEEPWDPAQIRVATKTFSLRQVLDQIDDDDMELAPDFQRNRVWSIGQKSRLIESVLLQIPLPAFYFAEDKEGRLRVVDGLQRLSTIHAFVRGKDGERFGLKGLEYLTVDAEGKRFDDLPQPWKRRLYNTQIVAHVIDPTTPGDVKYDIFKRINTGGSPLNNQEIRHCMSNRRSREFLKRCANTPEFDRATAGKLRNHVRMNDREMILRFCAFRLLGQDAYYEKYRAIDPYLEEATDLLDDESAVPNERIESLLGEFRRAMTNAYEVFGENAFRKWPEHSTGLNPINRTLFETPAVTLADHSTADLRGRRDAIVARARTLMTDDYEYINAISTSTGDPNKVRYRFTKTAEAAEAGR